LAIDRVAQVNNVTLGIGAPQYLPITLSGGSLSTFFIGRDNTCATFASLGAACGQNAAGEDVLTVRTGLEIKAKILPPMGVSPELDQHLSCLVDYDGCIALANDMLDAEGLVDTDGDGIRNLSTGSNWRISSNTNAGNTVREGYNAVICDGWRQLGVDCAATSIAFATLVAQLTGAAEWSGTILLGLTGGDPAGGVNVYKCGSELYFWHFSCDPEATSGPTAQTPDGAVVEAGFDAGFAANSVEDAQAGFDQFQLAWAASEPMIHLAVQNALFATRTDRLCNDGRATVANDDVKFKIGVGGNSCPSNAGR
jgi:ABC-type transport system substrate-binding protein